MCAQVNGTSAVLRHGTVLEQLRTGGECFAREVAVSLYKLMAYKNEYEVARLYLDTGLFDRVAAQLEGDYSLRFHLAPPLFAKRDAATAPRWNSPGSRKGCAVSAV
jgi:indolepyruvate ferredoxin oxidoreductase